VLTNLFGKGESAVGERVRVKGQTFNVIGVCATKGASGPFDPDDMIYIPISTAIYRLIGTTKGSSTRDAVSGITLLALT